MCSEAGGEGQEAWEWVGLKDLGPGKAEGRVLGERETFLGGVRIRKTGAVREILLGACSQRGKRKGGGLTEERPGWPLVQTALLPPHP